MNSHLGGYVSPDRKPHGKHEGHICVHPPTDPVDTEILLGCCDSGAGDDPVNGFEQEEPATLCVKLAPGLGLEGFTRGPGRIEEIDLIESDDFRDKIALHDPNHPERLRKLENHPERRRGEVYLMRITKVCFDLMPWKTKRLGDQVRCGCFPVFVAQSELEEAGYCIVKPDEFERETA